MEYKNIKSDRRKETMDYPQETDIDYENENNNDEKLKKLGRQVED